jgi:hypothetical protein
MNPRAGRQQSMNLYEKPAGVSTRWISFENNTLSRGRAGLENSGSKGHAFDHIESGETKSLLDVEGQGTIRRIWLTIDDRSPDMLRSLRLDMHWDGAEHPAVSAPLGDFFGVGLGRRTAFENALFSDPEGRSFNCFIPMPFRRSARITLTNESPADLRHLFYDIDLLIEPISNDALYFHAHWRRESPNALGKEYRILPRVIGNGRFIGSNVGIVTDPRYESAWWGEGEVKVRFGDDEHPTLCGSGTEDYIGTAWGQGIYSHRTQGCLVADGENGHWCFYRYHLDDPVYFDGGCEVGIQTIGGNDTFKVLDLIERGVPATPVSVDTGEVGGFIALFDGKEHSLGAPELRERWCNFWRQDDWSSTAYFYLDRPESGLPLLIPVADRILRLTAG